MSLLSSARLDFSISLLVFVINKLIASFVLFGETKVAELTICAINPGMVS